MKLQNLKIGDKITHYCSGNLVKGIVKKVGFNFVETEHEPICWGENIYTKTTIQKSLFSQHEISQTTPGSFYNGIRIIGNTKLHTKIGSHILL